MLKKVRNAVENGAVIWRQHALSRMLERGIRWSENDHTAYVITAYFSDKENFEQNGETRKQRGTD